MKLGAILTAPTDGSLAMKLNSVKRAGYSRVQVNLSSPPTEALLKDVFSGCLNEGLQLSALGCYANPLQLSSRRANGVSADDLIGLLELLPAEAPAGLIEPAAPWRIVTWSGTLSGQLFTPHPGNTSPAARNELAVWIQTVLPVLDRKNVNLLFKPHYSHVLNNPLGLGGFLSHINHPAIGMVMDPCNFLIPKNFHERDAMLAQAIKNLATYTELVHIKDARIDQFKLVLCGPGQGQMGIGGLLKLFKQHVPEAVWLIDAVEGELQLKRSREFVELQARLAGVE